MSTQSATKNINWIIDHHHDRLGTQKLNIRGQHQSEISDPSERTRIVHSESAVHVEIVACLQHDYLLVRFNARFDWV